MTHKQLSTSTACAIKQAQRKQIAQDIANFVAGGGEVKKVIKGNTSSTTFSSKAWSSDEQKRHFFLMRLSEIIEEKMT